MKMKVRQKSNQRTEDQIKKHYEIERELAKKLKNATKEERRYLYTSLYNELFRRVPDHPQLIKKTSLNEKLASKSSQISFLKRFLTKDSTFLEVGSGDCSLSFMVAEFVKKVYAIDVSEEISMGNFSPDNFKLIISDGVTIPLQQNSIDVAYSNQLMEHLHPDDAFEQLQNIYNAISNNGIYICLTPNRLSGPHDVSRFFDPVATGFHLKEYTNSEIARLFKLVGFSTIKTFVKIKSIYIRTPSLIILFLEKMFNIIPAGLKTKIARSAPFRVLLGISIIGIK